MLKTTVTTVNNDEHAAPNQIGETNQRVHVVAKGETLWSLGRRYGVAWTEILAVNEALNPNRISIGTKLVIPQSGKMN
jgi:LysM repeat protein